MGGCTRARTSGDPDCVLVGTSGRTVWRAAAEEARIHVTRAALQVSTYSTRATRTRSSTYSHASGGQNRTALCVACISTGRVTGMLCCTAQGQGQSKSPVSNGRGAGGFLCRADWRAAWTVLVTGTRRPCATARFRHHAVS
jgi:hypothetical protein